MQLLSRFRGGGSRGVGDGRSPQSPLLLLLVLSAAVLVIVIDAE